MSKLTNPMTAKFHVSSNLEEEAMKHNDPESSSGKINMKVRSTAFFWSSLKLKFLTMSVYIYIYIFTFVFH